MGERTGMCAFCLRQVRLDRFQLVGKHRACKGRGFPAIRVGDAIPLSWLEEPR